MKIRIFSITLALCLTLGMLFASCGKEGTDKENENHTSAVTYLETEKESSSQTAADTLEKLPYETESDEEKREPIENEKAISFIEFQYAKALEAIEIAHGNLSFDGNNEMVTADGKICYPITDTTVREELEGGYIDSLEDLSKYLRFIFVQSIADDLIDIAMKFYVDVNGILCLKTDGKVDGMESETQEGPEYTEVPEEDGETSHEEGRPSLVVASTEFFLSKFTDNLFRYTAKVIFEGQDEVEYFDFIFENTGSGWYFTQFPSLPQ